MDLYPVHLLLEGRTTLVVGGGAVAARKIRALARSGAHVRAVALDCSEEMELAIADLGFPCERRAFTPEDLRGAWLVIGATDDPAVHQQIFEEARRLGTLVHIVDDPARSDFIMPAVHRRGDLIVTVSTSGIAPALAARLRDQLAESFGEPYGRVLESLKAVREQLKEHYPDFESRKEAWYRLLDDQVLPALRRNELDEITWQPSESEERA